MRTVLKSRLARAVAAATAGVIAVMGVATTADAHDWKHRHGWRHHNGYGWNAPLNRWALSSGYYYNTWPRRYYRAPVYAAPIYRPYYGAPAYWYYGG